MLIIVRLAGVFDELKSLIDTQCTLFNALSLFLSLIRSFPLSLASSNESSCVLTADVTNLGSIAISYKMV